MAKKTGKNQDQFEQIGDTISKTEQYIEHNQKRIGIIAGLLIVVIILFFQWTNNWRPATSAEAQSDMYMAQIYFEQDSFNLALNGDGQFLGFLDLAEEYSFVKEGKLASYYAGVCFLNMGDYESAIEYLNDFSSNDILLSSLALGMTGDCYMEIGNKDKALAYYEDAADNNKNDFTTPIYLFKQALIHEENGDYKKALTIYNTIKEEHKDFEQARNINISKYISRIETRIENR